MHNFKSTDPTIDKDPRLTLHLLISRIPEVGLFSRKPLESELAHRSWLKIKNPAFLDMLGVFAEFETNLRRGRQLEGIAKAKAAGVYKGRQVSVNAEEVRKMKADGFGPTDIAKALKIGKASFYRVLSS
jgi:Helix-turn-helix domain of resolvase